MSQLWQQDEKQGAPQHNEEPEPDHFTGGFSLDIQYHPKLEDSQR